mgnify:CR=1 FL=1
MFYVQSMETGKRMTVSDRLLGHMLWKGTKEAYVLEASSSLIKNISDLYKAVITMKTKNPFDIDDSAIDTIMEKIVKGIGYTPEQKKIKSSHKFAHGGLPKFEILTDQQLKAIEPFLKAVQKSKYIDSDYIWDGTKLVDGSDMD